MREILFRGKRIDNEEWVEGGYNYKKVGGYFTDVFIIEHLTDGVCECHRVDPNTVSQYTGLTDKNGNRIFEGDIVRLLKVLFVVEYHGAEYVFRRIPGQPYCYPYFASHADSCEVIGNIHDNPELLEVSGDAQSDD